MLYIDLVKRLNKKGEQMYLKLDDKFVITTDKNNFVLNELKVKGKESKNVGEEYLVALAFMVWNWLL